VAGVTDFVNQPDHGRSEDLREALREPLAALGSGLADELDESADLTDADTTT